mgnify:FL=1
MGMQMRSTATPGAARSLATMREHMIKTHAQQRSLLAKRRRNQTAAMTAPVETAASSSTEAQIIEVEVEGVLVDEQEYYTNANGGKRPCLQEL